MRQGTSSRWRLDLALVAAATAGAYVIGSALELHEVVAARLMRFERWQADEIPLCLTVLACGFAWYVWRRRQEMLAQLALREAAEVRIADLLVHNRELARRMIAMQESERVVLARELHDELGQSCAAIRAETAFLCGCAPGDRAGILGAARRADAATQTLYRLLSGMLRRLRPAQLDALGLTAALEELCDAWEERTGVHCVLDVDGEIDHCGDPLAITVYRVVQEALTNVGRHAQAGRVVVRVQRVMEPSTIVLSIEDDGVGMDLDVVRHGLGLLGATERVAAADGSLSVASSPGHGVTVAAEIPWTGSPQLPGGLPTEQVWKVAA
ncbi:MAG: ATP-binding protein [Burkholderiaceae bacterium]